MTVRVRFAPSPTGYLHIGGVRTALFNWLWAKKQGGTFVLRIEDTDQARSTPENEAIILESLKWLGLDWAEGPDVGGPFGPYRQMERLALYHAHAKRLIDQGLAYRCTCTKEDLEKARAELTAKDPKAQFRYPGTCRDKQHLEGGAPFVVRFKAPSEGVVTYVDKVFGEVTTPNDTHQDFVLVRSDGVPLYNFGAVVDDITMGITLVARGRDHMINTPPQILLYRALGAPVPEFAHLPMMLGADGAKLSKRHGAVSVGEYQKTGIPPHALLNYLSRFGWSFGDEEIFSLADLVAKFDWERCGRGDGKFDAKKFAAVTFEHMKSPALLPDDAYLEGLAPFVAARGVSFDRELARRALPLFRERGQNWVQTAELMDYLFRDEPVFDEKAKAKFLIAAVATPLEKVAEMLSGAEDFSPAALETRFSALLADLGVEMKVLAQPVRVALSGRSASPGLFEVAALLGKERAVARLTSAVAIARAQAS
jgi:glutamyl-tRNA synthetase